MYTLPSYSLYKDNEIIGYCCVKDNTIWDVIIREDMRGCGFGKYLIKYVRDLHGYGIKLSVKSDNTTAINLYTKLGF